MVFLVLEGIRAAFDLFVDYSSRYFTFAVASEVLGAFVALIVARKVLTVLGVIKR